jgi:G3E family GTPase
LEPPKVRLNLLFGFLGSGKTTLARRLLGQPTDDKKTAVIVNEFGDVGIDGAILKGRNVDMIELNSGCLCCTLKGSLLSAVEELAQKAGARRIIVEATGVASPEEMLDTFADPSLRGRYEIGPLVTVVDAARFLRLSDMLGEFYNAQIETADLIILNKTDLAPAAMLEQVRQQVKELNNTAEIEFAERCDVDVGEVVNGPPSRMVARFAHDDSNGHDHHEHDDPDHAHAPAESFVVAAGREFALPALRAAMQDLGDNVWRAKGFVRAEGRAWLVQYTTSGLEVTEAEDRPHYNLVFIGKDMDRARIEARLEKAAAGMGQTQGAT